jgi:hypothetical protein
MSPELASAFLMFAGLSQTPNVLECAQTIDKYERAITAAKTVRVEFVQTINDGLTKTENKRTGVFLMRREGNDTQWQFELTDPANNQDKESWTYMGNSLWETRWRTKYLNEHPLTPKQQVDFDRHWIAVILPAIIPSVGHPIHDLVPVKCDDNYLYVRLIPKKELIRPSLTILEAFRAFLSFQLGPDPSEVRLVFCRKSYANRPLGVVRQYACLQDNGDVMRIDFSKWIIDDADDVKNLKIDKPTVPDGWKTNIIKDSVTIPAKKQ